MHIQIHYKHSFLLLVTILYIATKLLIIKFDLKTDQNRYNNFILVVTYYLLLSYYYL